MPKVYVPNYFTLRVKRASKLFKLNRKNAHIWCHRSSTAHCMAMGTGWRARCGRNQPIVFKLKTHAWARTRMHRIWKARGPSSLIAVHTSAIRPSSSAVAIGRGAGAWRLW